MNADIRNSGDPVPADSFDDLVAEAQSADFSGWDFSWLRGRTSAAELSWSYPDLARRAISRATRLLDIDTGGGEQLVGLQPLPAGSVATEGWLPNIPVAQRRLAPLGVEIRRAGDDGLPVADGEFDLVLNRHGTLDVAETWRALTPGGILLAQQVGCRNDVELNVALGAPSAVHPGITLEEGVAALHARGFEILEAREEMPEYVFFDIGAIVYQLLAVPWQISDFNVDRYRPRLRALHERIRKEGRFVARDHRFLIHARKSELSGPVRRSLRARPRRPAMPRVGLGSCRG